MIITMGLRRDKINWKQISTMFVGMILCVAILFYYNNEIRIIEGRSVCTQFEAKVRQGDSESAKSMQMGLIAVIGAITVIAMVLTRDKKVETTNTILSNENLIKKDKEDDEKSEIPRQLKELKDKGILTKDEFNAKIDSLYNLKNTAE